MTLVSDRSGTTAPAPAPPVALDAATDAATHALVNCYLREATGWRFVDSTDGAVDRLEIALASRDAVVRLAVVHRSPSLRHRFALPADLQVGSAPARPLAFATLACLLLDELAVDDPRGTGAPTVVLERIIDSLHAVAHHLDVRRDEIDRLWGAEPLSFAETEQALLIGHQTHPTPKSRGEMSGVDRARYSPETAGSFALRWFAVDPDLVRARSATGTPAADLAAGLLSDDPAVGPEGLAALRARAGDRVLVPSHPWEASWLLAQADVAALVADGAIIDLGEHGSPVSATTSVRTVHRADWAWQLKFSLHVRVTNSMRVTLPKELDRAVEAALLSRTAVGEEAARVAPRFRFVHDPAYLAVTRRDGTTIDGFSVLLRENPWPGADGEDVTALTTLAQDHPFQPDDRPTNRAGAIVRALAATSGRPVAEVGREWFARYLDCAVRSLVRLYLDLGLCFEAHQQNTLLELDDGWPARCAYRDSQGYFHRELAHEDLTAVIAGLGEASESIFPEDLADERLVYYLFVNQALGVVNTLGVAGVADERVLLADLRAVLEDERTRGGRYPATLLDRLLDDDRWPCKANLRTRVHDLDELVGDIATQSVYGSIPNPLRAPS